MTWPSNDMFIPFGLDIVTHAMNRGRTVRLCLHKCNI